MDQCKSWMAGTSPAMTREGFPPTLGLILAGGQATRMGGGDKGLRRLGDRTILDRVLERMRPQCTALVLNANGDSARFASYGLPVVPDEVPDFAGPLAGVLAGLDWTARADPDTEWVVSVPGDCPFLPRDLVAGLHQARLDAGRPLACARSGEWRHPVVALWPVSLRADLRHALFVDDLHKIERFTERYGVAIAEWPDRPVDPFFNVNTPEDLAKAGAIAAQHADG
jgi:molybdopterin-guanine dinucleotide biosynthesis protein A